MCVGVPVGVRERMWIGGAYATFAERRVGWVCHDAVMAYDKELATRVRSHLASERGFAEKRMFGGLAFLIEGSMALAVSGKGGLMARVDPDEGVALIERDGVAPMIMNRRPMRGWLRVAPDVVVDDAALGEWVARCVGYVKGTVNAPARPTPAQRAT